MTQALRSGAIARVNDNWRVRWQTEFFEEAKTNPTLGLKRWLLRQPFVELYKRQYQVDDLTAQGAVSQITCHSGNQCLPRDNMDTLPPGMYAYYAELKSSENVYNQASLRLMFVPKEA